MSATKPTLRTASITLMLGLLLAGLSLAWEPSAQAQNQAPSFTPGASPPFWDAFRNAGRLSDPQKKIEALEKVIADFPDSPVAPKAHQMIVNTLIENRPSERDRVLKHIEQAIETTFESGQVIVTNDMATSLVDAGLLLDQATELANKAMAMATTRFKDVNEVAMRQANFTYDTLRGTIHLKQGKLKDAERNLLSAYRVYTPGTVGGIAPNSIFKLAAYGLAELAEKEGQTEQAIDYLLNASLLGRINAQLLPENAFLGKIDAKVAQRLHTLYRKTHQDSLAGLEEMLDARYEKEFPPPVSPQPYKPTATRSDRAVLAEVFTGSSCVPCVAVDLSFDAFLERYQHRDLIVLMYHQHAPQPDPMANPFTRARAKSYDVHAVPRVAIDGRLSQEGGGGRSLTKQVHDKLRPLIEKQLEVKAEAKIKLVATMANSVVQVSAEVKSMRTDQSNLKLHLALVEERLRFMGENRVRFHPMVVRSLAGENASGLPLTDQPGAIPWRFDLNAITQELKQHLDNLEKDWKGETYTFVEKKHALDPSKLLVVAFVQDEKSKQVLQAASVKVSAASPSPGIK